MKDVIGYEQSLQQMQEITAAAAANAQAKQAAVPQPQ